VNILCDEGVDSEVVAQLRHDGHSVFYVAEMEPGIDDDTVLRRANELSALLVTEDKDFGEMVFRQSLVSQGVVLIRLHGLLSATKARIVATAFQQHLDELPTSFSVISPGMTRIRRKT
jgi:hypothetical protein